MFILILKKLLGVLCIVAGIFFGFVPLIPGFVLVLLGLELLGVPIIPWERIKEYLKKKKKEEVKTVEDQQSDKNL